MKGVYHNRDFESLYKHLYGPLYFYAVKFIHDKEVAKDLVQDAFLNLLKSKIELNQIQYIKSYLFKSVRNNCINYLNHIEIEHEYHQKQIDWLKREIEYYDSHKSLVEMELYNKITEAIKVLPDQYRIPFEMNRFGNMKYSEIAKKLKIPIRTVETQIYRALTMLRTNLKDMKK